MLKVCCNHSKTKTRCSNTQTADTTVPYRKSVKKDQTAHLGAV